MATKYPADPTLQVKPRWIAAHDAVTDGWRVYQIIKETAKTYTVRGGSLTKVSGKPKKIKVSKRNYEKILAIEAQRDLADSILSEIEGWLSKYNLERLT